jgi:hypothetical protein
MGTSRKKERRRQKRSLREAARRIMSKSAINGETVILAGDESRKMSESILHLAEPLLEHSMDEERALSLAAIAWNLSLIPEDERGPMLEKLLRQAAETDPEIERGLRVLLKDLVERKLELYPDDRRMILGHELAQTGEDMMLNVVSTIMPQERAKNGIDRG